MRTKEQIADELTRLEEANYYSEDFEWLSSVRAYRDSLCPEEQNLLAEIVASRLLREGSMTDVLMCSIIHVPSAGSVLAAKLDREVVPSQLTRALITALQHYRGDDVFRAVARFVDSDQENEALRALAKIDFHRALPYIARAARVEHQRDLVLHILHDRFKERGRLQELALELRAFAAGWQDPDFLGSIVRLLRCKPELYNPFREEEICFLESELLSS
ncbi:MAG: hypothetical protein NZ740_03545 [Kiritimatiellae bacterium]|nr:hypothetical protein [Kiritimatiellia bacterium]MDW8458165.1 hypothetical protein [Verrucomicrobiota bacterium]